MAVQTSNESTQTSSQGQQTRQGQQTQQGQAQDRTALSRQSRNAQLPSLWSDPLELFNPFALMRRMQDEVSRAFSTGGRSGENREFVWVPPIETQVRDNTLVVSAELPGVPEENIEVHVTDDALIIRGERQEQRREENEGNVRRTELRYGEFYRAIPLPEGAHTDQARAEIRNGVLEVTIPLSQQKQNTRQIPVQASGSSQSTSRSKGAQGTTSGSQQTKEKAA